MSVSIRGGGSQGRSEGSAQDQGQPLDPAGGKGPESPLDSPETLERCQHPGLSPVSEIHFELLTYIAVR